MFVSDDTRAATPCHGPCRPVFTIKQQLKCLSGKQLQAMVKVCDIFAANLKFHNKIDITHV